MTDRTRHIGRATEEYFLRFVALISTVFPNDLIRGVIWLAINNANVQHLLDDKPRGALYASVNRPVPDAERRAVSRSAIAQSLGMPLETCRRHVNALIAEGLCREVDGGGVIVPADQLNSPQFRDAMAENAVNLRRLLSRLDIRAEL
jgi:hypothetical protein